MDNKQFFFCYNKDLAKHLTNNNFRYITIAKEPKNLKTFTLFYRSEELENELTNYKNHSFQ